jgi:hypothetical protein
MIDLISPHVYGTLDQVFSPTPGIDVLIDYLAADLDAGCLQFSSEMAKSRGLVLVQQGLVVGCMHNSKVVPKAQITEESLKHSFRDFRLKDCQAVSYKLPGEIVSCISALFIGYPVQKNTTYTPRSYLNAICEQSESRKGALCFAITHPSFKSHSLAFFYRSKFSGVLNVRDQLLVTDPNSLDSLLSMDPASTIEACILPDGTIGTPSLGFDPRKVWNDLNDG